MFFEIANLEDYFGPLRLFRYLSLRCVLAAASAFFIGIVFGPYIITMLRRLKCGQSFRSKEEVGDLAQLHSQKAGTPAMGGLIIFLGVTVATILFAKLNTLVLIALFVYTSFTILGFADDYTKIVKKNSKGISGKLKLSVQLIVSLITIVILYSSSKYGDLMKELWVPFLKEPLIASMPLWFAFIFIFFVIGGSSNALNLTDGVDGLAVGCTVSVALTYAIFAYVTGNTVATEYLFLGYIPDCGELAVVCCALLGGCLAFLWFNAHPAEVFMGDTGSLALGGIIGAIAFMVHQPIVLILAGGIFVMEAVSVILQVASYKTRKVRIFRMAPIHHHFELGGLKETKVVIRFWIVSLIFALASLATLKLR